MLQVNILKPFQGWEEINPNELQNGVKQVLQNALKGLILLTNRVINNTRYLVAYLGFYEGEDIK